MLIIFTFSRNPKTGTCWGSRKLVSTRSPVKLSVSGLSCTNGFVWFSDSQIAVMLLSLTKDSGRCWIALPAKFSTARFVMWPTSRGILKYGLCRGSLELASWLYYFPWGNGEKIFLYSPQDYIWGMVFFRSDARFKCGAGDIVGEYFRCCQCFCYANAHFDMYFVFVVALNRPTQESCIMDM